MSEEMIAGEQLESGDFLQIKDDGKLYRATTSVVQQQAKLSNAPFDAICIVSVEKNGKVNIAHPEGDKQ